MTTHIYAPRATAKFAHAQTCPDCKKRTRILSFFTPWIGQIGTYLRCGREFGDGEWLPLDFARGVRQRNIAHAKRVWRAMPPRSENHYGLGV